MPDKSKQAPPDPQASTDVQLENVAEVNDASMEIFTQACQAYTVGMATLNSELISFVNGRAGRDARLGQALCRCRNWSEAVELQNDWARQASQEYLTEASQLMELASKVAKDHWDPVYKRANDRLATLHDPDHGPGQRPAG